jgi:hypothetical protein
MSAASVKYYTDRNWDGFYSSPEYAEFYKWMGGIPDQQDVYVSPYFGDVPGRVIGVRLDSTFEQFQERIQNPGRVPYPIYIEGSNTTKSSGFPWLLLVAAAAAFALS